MTIEPPLQALTETDALLRSANVQENARLDISCRSFWRPLQKAFFDVRITHPNCASNENKPVEKILKANETAKKREYNDRVRDIEFASFTPLVFSTNGAMGEEAAHFPQILAEKISDKTNNSYAETVTYLRKRLSFTILRTALIALRGKRKNPRAPTTNIAECDINIAANTLR